MTRFVGLDVHADTVTVAVAELGRSKPTTVGTYPNEWPKIRRQLRQMGGPATLACCYEAGPTGYGLYRSLASEGYDCVVVAPSLTPVKPGCRIKTDNRDAATLAGFLRTGDLTPIYVPEEATEALRDLVRARADAKKLQKIARQLLSLFLLRYGRRYPGKTNWTKAHIEWVGSQKFEHEAQRRVLADHLQEVHNSTERVDRLTRDIDELIRASKYLPLVEALQALRGIDLVAAATLLVELGDLRRFPSPKQLMAYVGITPSEHSSGQSRQRGRITKAGNSEARRIFTEAAWAYRWPPRLSKRIATRSSCASAAVRAISWKAQHRLHGKYQRLLARGKDKKKTIIAVARELVGFVWAVAHEHASSERATA
jgi:transposase